MRRSVLIVLAVTVLLVIFSSTAQPASAYTFTPGWNRVGNANFDEGYDGWSERFQNPTGGESSHDRSIFGDSATDFSLVGHPQISLGSVLQLHVRQEGGVPGAGVRYSLYQSRWKTVTDLTVIYGLMTCFGERTSPVAKGVGIGVHLQTRDPYEGYWYDLGNLEYYVSNGVVLSDTATEKFIKIVSDGMTQPGTGSAYTYYGISNDRSAGRRLKADIDKEYPGNPDVAVSEVHVWSYMWAGLIGEDIWGRFKCVTLGDYPSPALAASTTAMTDAGWGLPTSTSLALNDGGVPTHIFPQDGYFQNHPAAFRGGVTYSIKLTGATTYTYSDRDWTVSYSDINRGRYATSGTVTCGDGVTASASGSNIVNGYALHVVTKWAPNTQGTATLTYQQNGQTSNAYLDSSTANRETYVIADPNSNAQLSQQPSSWSTERTITYDTRSWFSIGSSQTVTVNYIRQFKVTLNPLNQLGGPLGRIVDVMYTGDSGGNHVTNYLTTFSAEAGWWMDDGSTVYVGKETGGDSAQDQWYCYNWTLSGNWRQRSVSEGTTYHLRYCHQFRLELELMSSQYGGAKVYDEYSYLAVGDSVRGCAWLWDSDIDSRPASVGTFTFRWITPSGQVIHTDSLQSSSCYTDVFQIPQTYGEWKLQVAWSDGAAVVYNKTVPFYVYGNTLQTQARDDGTDNNVNLTVNLSLVGGNEIPQHSMLIAVTSGTGTTRYTRNLNLIYGGGLAEVASLSTSFFTLGSGATWTTHIVNLDPASAHQVAFRVRVYDPLTGYTYMNQSSSRLLGIGGEGDLTLALTPLSSWWRNGLLRVVYTFYVYDSMGVNILGYSMQDFGNADPVSWVMKGTGIGELKAVYYMAGITASTSSTPIPTTILSSSMTARFYLAWEDCHALSTEEQISPVVMHYVNVTFEAGNIFATGCIPPSTWVTEGTNVTLTVGSPFYPKPPYYSSTTRFMFLQWKWSNIPTTGGATQNQQWAFANNTRISIRVTQPTQAVACWGTQFLVEFTPYVPTAAPTDTVQVSYTANNTQHNTNVRSGEKLRVWVDAHTFFVMHDLWVNDYTWYQANYETPCKNVTGGASLTLDYVEKRNQVNSVLAESNTFAPGDTLKLNITVTTTYYNAAWINATIVVASRNTILVDRNGLAWSNMRIQLQNNTAMIVVSLPQDIGNGTLTILLKAYGRVEPTTTQIDLTSSAAPPEQGGGGDDFLGGTGLDLTPTIAFMGIAFGIVFGASVSVKAMMGRMKRRRRDRDALVEAEPIASIGETTANAAPTASALIREGNRVAELQPLSLVRALALMELDVEKGVQLTVLKDGSSRFIRYLKRDVTRCGDYFDTAAKSYPGTLSITKWGDHITFIPYSKRGCSGRGHHMKSVLIVSTTRELQNSETKELTKTMRMKPINMNGEPA